ncbi:hypothetical protein [Gaoshiqia sp. Z1-71]|uniref:hypothetical protein n=1 Tax=Gaoshiqia hydrogeniformans TaxID=3290090 RepID=UPI003BF83408
MKLATLILLLFISAVSFSQHHKLALVYGYANNDVYRVNELDGAAGYHGKSSYLIGLNYQKALVSSLWFETGLEYSRNKIEITPAPNPEIDLTARQTTAELLTIPAYGNLSFLKYFFVNGGLLLDFDIKLPEQSIDSQTGIGFGFGIGGEINIKQLHFFANAFLKNHAVIAFDKERNQQHLVEDGLKFGIGYSF